MDKTNYQCVEIVRVIFLYPRTILNCFVFFFYNAKSTLVIKEVKSSLLFLVVFKRFCW